METLIKDLVNWKDEQLAPEQLLDQLTGLAFCLTDHEGNFVEVNTAYTELYGYTEDELIGQHFTKVVPEDYRETAAKIHDDFIAGQNEMPAEWTVVGKDGAPMQIMVHAVRGASAAGKPMKVTIIERLDS